MHEPPRGICTACNIVRVIDGDTVVVEGFGREWSVRLLDCWAKEVSLKRGTSLADKQAGLAAKASLEALVAVGKRFSLFVPAPADGKIAHIFTMGRVLGRVFVDGEDVSEYMVRHGYATVEKPGGTPGAQNDDRATAHQ